MQTIIITSTERFWQEAQRAGEYTQSTLDAKLDEVGFIHATSPHQTTAMLNRRFADRDDIILLLVNLDKVKPEVKFEEPLSSTKGLFPHIYGPLNLDAVYRQIKPTKDSSGNFVDSDELQQPAV